MMWKIVLVALGGALGAMSRAGLGIVVQRLLGPKFPWGTLAVNVLGCFLFGLVWALTEARQRDVTDVRLFLLTGYMGSLTTFSTFAFDSVTLGEASKTGLALGNVAVHNGVGLVCVLAGLALGRLV